METLNTRTCLFGPSAILPDPNSSVRQDNLLLLFCLAVMQKTSNPKPSHGTGRILPLAYKFCTLSGKRCFALFILELGL